MLTKGYVVEPKALESALQGHFGDRVLHPPAWTSGPNIHVAVTSSQLQENGTIKQVIISNIGRTMQGDARTPSTDKVGHVCGQSPPNPRGALEIPNATFLSQWKCW